MCLIILEKKIKFYPFQGWLLIHAEKDWSDILETSKMYVQIP